MQHLGNVLLLLDLDCPQALDSFGCFCMIMAFVWIHLRNAEGEEREGEELEGFACFLRGGWGLREERVLFLCCGVGGRLECA